MTEPVPNWIIFDEASDMTPEQYARSIQLAEAALKRQEAAKQVPVNEWAEKLGADLAEFKD